MGDSPVGQAGLVASFALIHSPLVGPMTWSGVGHELRRRGHEVAIPSIREAAMSGSWRTCLDAVLASLGPQSGVQVLVGHSGAGLLLPVIAAGMDRGPDTLVFVDSVLPPPRGNATTSHEFLAFLGTIERDGRLPRWSEWFGPGVMESLVPDASTRRAIVDEMPELPVSYYLEQHIPMPHGWGEVECTYVCLSEAYRTYADSATERGWTVIDAPGTHLDIVTRPADMAEILVGLSG